MAIKPPAWCAHAVPDKNKGWVDPKSGELYKSSRFTQAEVDAFHGNVAPVVQEATQEDVQDMITEGKIQSAMMDMELQDMSKVELEELGRENGVELDRRKSKKSLVQTMKKVLSK